jgi:hypothetical protein
MKEDSCSSRVSTLFVCLITWGLIYLTAGCMTSMLPGNMESIQPSSSSPRVGSVYLIRGWGGMFSWGIDDMARELNRGGVRASVFQHDQRDALVREFIKKYQGVSDSEPLCIVAHSAGSDDAIYIARELQKMGINVDLLIALDGVDEVVIPKNVKICYNYWMPGAWGDSNFLRGLPYEQEPGSSGKLTNINLQEEGRSLREAGASHTTLDKDLILRQVVINKIFSVWRTQAGR